jgi:hypothetical protein
MKKYNRLGIDPADLEFFDESKVRWDSENQQWVMGDGESLYCHMYGPKIDKLPVGNTFIWDAELEEHSVHTTPKYSPELDKEYSETILLATLYQLGFSDTEIESLSIDNAVKRVRSTYNYTMNKFDCAGKTFVKRKNIAIMRQLRRSYQKVQITDGLINGS